MEANFGYRALAPGNNFFNLTNVMLDFSIHQVKGFFKINSTNGQLRFGYSYFFINMVDIDSHFSSPLCQCSLG